MSRALADIVRAYNNMDIENLEQRTEMPVSDGLLTKKNPSSNSSSGIDYTKPAVRVAKQMQIIRNHRDEIKNGSI